jgi:hypothetical protein
MPISAFSGISKKPKTDLEPFRAVYGSFQQYSVKENSDLAKITLVVDWI